MPDYNVAGSMLASTLTPLRQLRYVTNAAFMEDVRSSDSSYKSALTWKYGHGHRVSVRFYKKTWFSSFPPLSALGKVGFLMNSYLITNGEVECCCATVYVKSHVVKLLQIMTISVTSAVRCTVCTADDEWLGCAENTPSSAAQLIITILCLCASESL